MKKFILMMAVVVMIVAFPLISYGTDYSVYNDDVTVSIDDSQWKVFTRDNIKNNKDLKKLGTDYKTMKNSMNNVNAYIVAVKEEKKANTELMLRATEIKYINNMNTLTDDELEAVRKGVQETYSEEIDNCITEVYQSDNCTYIKITGDYDDGEYNTIEYFTIINGINYLFTVQKKGPITSEEKSEVQGIVNSASFNVNPDLTANDIDRYIAEQEKIYEANQPKERSPLTKVLGVIIVVAGVVIILIYKNRKRNRK